MGCLKLKHKVVKKGKRNGIQRYFCFNCKKGFKDKYVYQSYRVTNQDIKRFVKEGVGIRSMSRLLKISLTTVLRRILKVASLIKRPMVTMGKEFELDEMRTYIGRKKNLYWIVYGLQRGTNLIANFNVGKRSNRTLRVVSDTLILSNLKRIFTDKWRGYLSLIPKEIHFTKQYSINHIERMNLSVRTHLKRLNRRTICYSKSIAMLMACLTIYFWG